MHEEIRFARRHRRKALPPRVTIVVTARERWSLTERALESVLADPSEPFELIYVVGGAPPATAAYLQRRAARAGFVLIEGSDRLWPNQARNLALPGVDTDYVAFVDNDVVVEPGWLKRLVSCADDTGAALVGPLYLWSDGASEPRIHMAGGTLTEADTPAGRALHERHELINTPLAERAKLTRRDCDFLEYHCLLARTDFVRGLGGLSQDVACVHEHIDIAREAAALGLRVLLEPAAAVDYLAFAPYLLCDLDFLRWRWNGRAVASSLAAFSAKWNLANDDAATKDVHTFAQRHLADVDPLAPAPLQRDTRPLTAGDIAQNLWSLLTQAHAVGYAKADLELFASAYHGAMRLFDGGYRPCGRPFIAHCTGTASALVRFGFAPRLVVAGLLHAAYSHTPLGADPPAALDDLQRQIATAFGERVERGVRRYARFQRDPERWRREHPLDGMSVNDAETIAIALADEIDLRAGGEAAYTRRPGLATAAWQAYFAEVAGVLGVPAFAETLVEMSKARAPEGFDMRSQVMASFRLARGGYARLAHASFVAWDEARSKPQNEASSAAAPLEARAASASR